MSNIKEKLHQLIRNSDLSSLKKYVDGLQQSLLSFNDPSLILLAIEVFLDPKAIHNEEYQMDIISFLFKIGVKLMLPRGIFFLYLYKFCEKKQNEAKTEAEKVADEKYFEERLKKLFDYLLVTEERYEILRFDLKPIENQGIYQQVTNYLKQHYAALKIQTTWRMHRQRSIYTQLSK